MVLTRRGATAAAAAAAATEAASREILRICPNELVTEIIQHTSRLDQLTLCRVSKAFHKLSLPILIRGIHINDYCSGAGLCQSLIDNHVRAEAVRSLTVVYMYFESWFAVLGLPDFSTLLSESLLLMLNLQQLALHPYILRTEHMLRLLKDAVFPRLQSCDIVPRTMENTLNSILPAEYLLTLSSFLNRHPSLKRLRIPSRNRITTSPEIRISLPKLQYYDGPHYLAPFLVARGLREARLWWDEADMHNFYGEHTISALGELADRDMPFCYVHEYHRTYDEIHAVVDAVSRHIPQTSTLLTRAQYPNHYEYMDEEEIADLIPCLLRFKPGLVYLALGWRRSHPQHVSAGHEKDQVALEKLARACPTLQACCLNDQAWRKGNETWEVVSLEEFSELVGAPDSGVDYSRCPFPITRL
ncbi:hypothetical protein DFH06DRAFT_154270 [Mycena polygramma]|nr:hypothetical protein DFH06DRAFT_154270 [Mycena polygramma]